eukprot:jgi/Ulvmu1/11170/UM072_0006.1
MIFQAAFLSAGLGLAAARINFPRISLDGRRLLEISVDELAFPQGQAQHEVATADSVVVDGVTYDTEYKPILRSGDVSGDGVFGLLVDSKGDGIMLDGEPFISNGADFNSLIPVDDYVCMLTHFEAPDPAATYMTTLVQNAATGELTPVNTMAMDWSAYEGSWVTCAGSVTPWQTHLGSEEFEPDARALQDAVIQDPSGTSWTEQRIASWATLYRGVSVDTPNSEILDILHPYLYGYPWETKPNVEDGVCTPAYNVKHMAAGRLAIEAPYVMPDGKTVYITDDGDNTMFGMFIASEAGDLSCGTPYGAKFTQIGDESGGTFVVEWIQVGEEACTKDFLPYARSTRFYDLFDTAPTADDGSCPEGFTSINAQPGGQECLSIKPGMELLASRFEYRRVAAMKGCTTEFTKWEGITFDPTRGKIYTAMSEIRRSMEDNTDEGVPDNSKDIGGPNDVRVEWNECGCVYALDVNADYRATTMYPLVCGNKDASTDEFNACNKEAISQPDNVAYVSGHDGLLIGEDTDAHQNDVIWYFDLSTSSLTRMLSTPYGSETTSPYWYPNINGWAYIMAVVQHPYGESDEERVDDPGSTGLPSWTGYMGPFRARNDSVDMTDADAMGATLWNGFPADALPAAALGGYGDH